MIKDSGYFVLQNEEVLADIRVQVTAAPQAQSSFKLLDPAEKFFEEKFYKSVFVGVHGKRFYFPNATCRKYIFPRCTVQSPPKTALKQGMG